MAVTSTRQQARVPAVQQIGVGTGVGGGNRYVLARAADGQRQRRDHRAAASVDRRARGCAPSGAADATRSVRGKPGVAEPWALDGPSERQSRRPFVAAQLDVHVGGG